MGTRSNRLAEAVLTSTHNLCFEQTYERYLNFLSKIFPFLIVKYSIYLNGRVSVMDQGRVKMLQVYRGSLYYTLG